MILELLQGNTLTRFKICDFESLKLNILKTTQDAAFWHIYPLKNQWESLKYNENSLNLTLSLIPI